VRRNGSISNLVALLGTTTGSLEERRPSGRLDTVYVLAVDVSRLSSSGRPILDLARRDRDSWLAEAARHATSTVILVTDETVEFYTTELDHLAAIRPQLKLLTDLTRGLPEFRDARVVEQTGPRALWRLMNFASGLWTDVSGAQRAEAEIQCAVAASSANKTLGPELLALFRAATNVGRRVAEESSLHDPRLCGTASRELEIPAVERIVEEELASFKSLVASGARCSRARAARVAPGAFEQSEPYSRVRLRVAVPVDLQIHYLDPHRKSS
jgi:hypothetical protein